MHTRCQRSQYSTNLRSAFRRTASYCFFNRKRRKKWFPKISSAYHSLVSWLHRGIRGISVNATDFTIIPRLFNVIIRRYLRTRCQSLSARGKRREKEPRCILKKECAFTPVVLVADRETSPRGKHDRFYDLLSRLASSPSQHLLLLSLTPLCADDSCSRAAL